MQCDLILCQVMDYCLDHKTPAGPFYKAFQPCSKNPTGIPTALHRSGRTLSRPRSRSTASNVSSARYPLSLCYLPICLLPEDNTIKTPCV